MFASGNFHDALNIYDSKGAIQWTRTQTEARAALLDQWTEDSAAEPEKTRFVFAYTNADVAVLNAALRGVRKERGELGQAETSFDTKHGRADFATADRIQFTGTDKKLGIHNGDTGTIEAIRGNEITVRLDGAKSETVTFNAVTFDKFRHGYAGTIYAGQGATLDQTYLYHSEHWRSASSYVAMTRHRDKAALFVARNTAKDVKQLAQQMGRTDDRRAASMFEIKRTQEQRPQATETRRLSPAELLAMLSPQPIDHSSAEPSAVHHGVRQARHYAAMDASHRGAEPSHRANDIEAAIARAFDVAGNRITESAGFDRDAANAIWQGRVDAAGIAHGEQRGNADPSMRDPIEPRETILEDIYPLADPGDALQARRPAAGIPTPAETSTGSAAPENDHSTGLLRDFAGAAEFLGRMLFGRRESEPAARPIETAEIDDAIDVRLAQTLRSELDIDGEHLTEEQEQEPEHSRKRGRSL